MASSYSTNLAIELIGTGDQAGTWGTTTNTNLGTLIEQAISGYVTQAVSTGTDTTITIPNGSTGVARNMYIELTGTGGASTNLIVPANKKLYFVFNNSTGAVTVKVSGQTGVSVPQGKKMILVSNGTDIVNGVNYIADFGTNSFTVTNLVATSATITNLLATSLTVSSGSTLNGGVVINELGADADTRIEGDTDANLFFVDASTDRIGVGTASPGQKLEVAGNIFVNTSGNPYAEIKTSGAGNNPSLKLTADTNSWTFQGTFSNANDDLLVLYNATTLLDLDKNGNLGLGVTPSAWSGAVKALQVVNAGIEGRTNAASYATLSANGYTDSGTWKYISSDFASRYTQFQSQHLWFTAPSGTAGNAITFTQAMTLDASGKLMVGTTTPATNTLVTFSSTDSVKINCQGGTNQNGISLAAVGGASQYYLGAGSGLLGGDTGIILLDVGNNRGVIYDNQTSGELRTSATTFSTFFTNGSERARITAGGDFCVGTTNAAPGGANVAGIALGGVGYVSVTRDGDISAEFNRKTNDGSIVSFRQGGTEEGTISVSGNTVSYNAFAGSHWSQLEDGSKPDILRGTVMESINELCVWPGEENERLPKAKISDTAGSKKVYGVFMAWDNDWTETSDMYVTAVGAFICRVNGSVTVQEGDLLESNGDGTARVQADDIIRSSTIGKVTSTVKTHEYDDGSYCVPTVLYCG